MATAGSMIIDVLCPVFDEVLMLVSNHSAPRLNCSACPLYPLLANTSNPHCMHEKKHVREALAFAKAAPNRPTWRSSTTSSATASCARRSGTKSTARSSSRRPILRFVGVKRFVMVIFTHPTFTNRPAAVIKSSAARFSAS